jgi:hypothetical protein
MPQATRALTRAARRRADARKIPYQTARDDVKAIRQLMQEEGLSWDDAEAVYDDPDNKVMCVTCGWLAGMACPACSGCGCNATCTGWRHEAYEADMDGDSSECRECGGHPDYTCQCG